MWMRGRCFGIVPAYAAAVRTGGPADSGESASGLSDPVDPRAAGERGATGRSRVESTIWADSVRAPTGTPPPPAATSVGDGESSLAVSGALDLIEERDREVFRGDLRSSR